MSVMTPREAAEWVEESAPIHITAKAPAVRVLIDHARASHQLGPDDVRQLRIAVNALDWADLTETIAEHTREIAAIRTLVERLIGGAS